MPRMRWIYVAVAVLAVALVASNAWWYYALPKKTEAKTIDVKFSWIIGSSIQYPYFVAVEKGYFAEEGLSPTAIPGKGSSDCLATLEAGKADIGQIGCVGEIMRHLAREDSDLKIVAVVVPYYPGGLLVRTDRITGFTDMEGKSTAASAYDLTTLWIKATMKLNDMDPDALTVVTAESAAQFPLLMAGDVDAENEYLGTAIPKLKAGEEQGVNLKFLDLADYGLKLYGDVIVVKEDLIDEDPDLIRGFLSAYLKGVRYMFLYPEQAAEIVHKYVPEVDVEDAEETIEGIKPTYWDDDQIGHGLGYMDYDKMKASQDETAEWLEPAVANLNLNDIYTNEFLPSSPVMPPT